MFPFEKNSTTCLPAALHYYVSRRLSVEPLVHLLFSIDFLQCDCWMSMQAESRMKHVLFDSKGRAPKLDCGRGGNVLSAGWRQRGDVVPSCCASRCTCPEVGWLAWTGTRHACLLTIYHEWASLSTGWRYRGTIFFCHTSWHTCPKSSSMPFHNLSMFTYWHTERTRTPTYS